MITSKDIINHIYINYDEKVINYYTFYDDNLQICSGGVAGKGTGGKRGQAWASGWQAVAKGGRRVHPRGICSLWTADKQIATYLSGDSFHNLLFRADYHLSNLLFRAKGYTALGSDLHD